MTLIVNTVLPPREYSTPSLMGEVSGMEIVLLVAGILLTIIVASIFLVIFLRMKQDQ